MFGLRIEAFVPSLHFLDKYFRTLWCLEIMDSEFVHVRVFGLISAPVVVVFYSNAWDDALRIWLGTFLRRMGKLHGQEDSG